MQDSFGRNITYLRVSVTDRCDMRCFYCMGETPTFRPRSEILSLEELSALCSAFINLGVSKLRLTGGEPLIRRNVMLLIKDLSLHLNDGLLKELALTTNASRLGEYALPLFEYGIRRINVSLDSLDSDKFTRITRNGDLKTVLKGIESAQKAGIKIKINTVALKGINDDEFIKLAEWCAACGFDLTFIEAMPIDGSQGQHLKHYLPLSDVRALLSDNFALTPIANDTEGPAEFYINQANGQKIGFIDPLSHNFCANCNRVRLTSAGSLYLCLGQEDKVELKEIIRQNRNPEALTQAIALAVRNKPLGHNFAPGQLRSRTMSVTGG